MPDSLAVEARRLALAAALTRQAGRLVADSEHFDEAERALSRRLSSTDPLRATLSRRPRARRTGAARLRLHGVPGRRRSGHGLHHADRRAQADRLGRPTRNALPLGHHRGVAHRQPLARARRRGRGRSRVARRARSRRRRPASRAARESAPGARLVLREPVEGEDRRRHRQVARVRRARRGLVAMADEDDAVALAEVLLDAPRGRSARPRPARSRRWRRSPR